MNVEYTGRHFEITTAIRKEVESGLSKIRKILRDKFETKVILTVEKHRHKAEITIDPPNGPLVGLGQAANMVTAVNQALQRLEKQAIKYKTRWRTQKRKSHSKWNGKAIDDVQTAVGTSEQTAVAVVVHKFPAAATMPEVHVVQSSDSVAMRAMTLEEAIKEAHFRDRDVFVFRDRKGRVMVLHRTRDGKMELIEAP